MQAAGLGNEKLPKEAKRGQPEREEENQERVGSWKPREEKCFEEEGVIRCVRYCWQVEGVRS